MNTKAFLKPLTVLFAALSASAHAEAPTSSAIVDQDHTRTISSSAGAQEQLPGEAREVVLNENGDLFKFVLQRTEDGQLVAQHYSHYSHQSHASHASHRSHYSSYQP